MGISRRKFLGWMGAAGMSVTVGKPALLQPTSILQVTPIALQYCLTVHCVWGAVPVKQRATK